MHLHLDCQFGMAGDMLLAALVDAGANQETLVETLHGLPLEGFDLNFHRTARNGVAAMLADVVDPTRPHGPGRHAHDHHHHEHGSENAHEAEHGGHDGDAHAHHHHHGEGGHASGGPHRHLGDLLSLLDSEALTPRVKERASSVFRILAEAEATVHGQPVDKVHFHEISGIDTAVDVIGSCLALELLQVDSISASPPAVGSGMLMCEHGIFPIPAPATLEILKSHNIPWRAGGEGERTTPTGVALLAALVESFGPSPEITVTRIGYGAGHREYEDVPNLLRAIVGKPGAPEERRRGGSNTIIAETEREPGSEVVPIRPEAPLLPAEIAALLPGDKAPDGDRVMEFRFVVDDMTPEAVAYLCERCLAGGAIEAYAVPATMKKGRAGHEITVLAATDLAALVADIIWRDSSTFGMRVGERSRLILSRDARTVSVFGHKVRVKLGWRNGAVIRRQPEYEDCRAAALATGKPLPEVYAMASALAADLE